MKYGVVVLTSLLVYFLGGVVSIIDEGSYLSIQRIEFRHSQRFNV